MIGNNEESEREWFGQSQNVDYDYREYRKNIRIMIIYTIWVTATHKNEHS